MRVLMRLITGSNREDWCVCEHVCSCKAVLFCHRKCLDSLLCTQNKCGWCAVVGFFKHMLSGAPSATHLYKPLTQSTHTPSVVFHFTMLHNYSHYESLSAAQPRNPKLLFEVLPHPIVSWDLEGQGSYF